MTRDAPRTLPLYVAPGLVVLSVGLNPSLPSAQAGFYFANPRNRFWRAFAASGMAPCAGAPSPRHHRRLLARGVGFADVVRRASRQGHTLRAADYRIGAPELLALLSEMRPRWAWFHGMVAYRKFLQYAPLPSPAGMDWGLQPERIGGARVYVTPNPSPANAAYSLEDLCARYRDLARRIRAAGDWECAGRPARCAYSAESARDRG